MIEQARQRILTGLFLGIVEELQVLNCSTSLGGKGQDNLFVQFAEVVRKAVWQYLVRERKVAEELVLMR
jgi:hypothetical protein